MLLKISSAARSAALLIFTGRGVGLPSRLEDGDIIETENPKSCGTRAACATAFWVLVCVPKQNNLKKIFILFYRD